MFLLWMLACADVPTEPSMAVEMAPLPTVQWNPGPLVRNSTANLDIVLPGPADFVWLVVTSSTTTGSLGPCFRGACVQLESGVHTGPFSTTTGDLSLTFDVPDAATIGVQVMALHLGVAYASTPQWWDTESTEVCDNGIDDDSNGLVDCEDSGCLQDAACAELDCSDGTDNDQDGMLDCLDEDCWGPGCEGTYSRLLGGHFELHANEGADWQSQWFSWLNHDFEMRSVFGEVQRVTSQGTSACTWTAPSILIDANGGGYGLHYQSSYAPAPSGSLMPTGFTLSPGCALSQADALPGRGAFRGFRSLPSMFDLNFVGPYYTSQRDYWRGWLQVATTSTTHRSTMRVSSGCYSSYYGTCQGRTTRQQDWYERRGDVVSGARIRVP